VQIILKDRLLVKDVDDEEEDEVNCAFAQVTHALLEHYTITERALKAYREAHLEMAEKLEVSMLELYQKTSQRPNTTSMNARISIFGAKRDFNGARKLLDSMIEAEDNGNNLISPNTVSFNVTINAYAKSGQVSSAREILLLMISRWQEGKTNAPPDIVTFNSLIDAHAKSRKREAGREAEQVLQWIDDLKNAGLSIHPDVYTYTAIINAHSKSATPERAELILNRLLQQQDEGGNVLPTIYTFTAVLNAMSLTKDPDAPERADKLMSFIWELNKTGVDISPDTESYNSLLTVWTRKARGPAAARKCWNTLKEMKENPIMPKPSRVTYEIVLSSLAFEDERNIELAEKLMNEMKSSLDSNLWPQTLTYNSYLNILSMQDSEVACSKAVSTFNFLKDNLKLGEKALVLSVVSYHVMMKAVMNHSSGEGAMKVIELLREMETMSRSGFPSLTPTSRSYSTCISAISRSRRQDRLKLARSVLDIMKDSYANGNAMAQANNRLFHELFLCYFHFVKSGIQRENQSALIREMFQLLEEMKEIYKCNPDNETFSIIIDTLKLLPVQDGRLTGMIQRMSAIQDEDSSKR
jgi:pentatricopeptide repeat protein